MWKPRMFRTPKGLKERKKAMPDKPDTAATKGNPPPAAKPASAAAGQSARQAATIRYIDRPDIEETFADSGQWPHLRWADAAHRVRGNAPRRGQGQHAAHWPPLSGQSDCAAAGSGGRSHQPHAADRGSAHAGRHGQGCATAGRRAEGRLRAAHNCARRK